MTVIAAISHPKHGAFLVGDSMLSINDASFRHFDVQFPFQGKINQSMGDSNDFSAVGHAQKIVKIRDDLYFTWAGDFAKATEAALLLRSLTKFSDRLSDDQISALADQLPPKGSSVAWILLAVAEDRKYALRSNVDPKPYDENTIIRTIGTGSPNFKRNLQNLNTFTGNTPSEAVKKLYQTLGYCGLSFMDHLVGDASPTEAWGGVMEAAYYTPEGIKRINPVTTFFWSGIEIKEGEWAIAFLPMFSYQYPDLESTTSFSYHWPSQKRQLIRAWSPFDTRDSIGDVPSSFQTNNTLHCVELVSPQRDTQQRRLIVDISDNPELDGVTLRIDGDRYICRNKNFRKKIFGVLPEGHRCSHLLGWQLYDPQFDWVTSLQQAPK